MTTIALGNKISLISLPKINWKIICFAGFFMSLVVLIFYVWQINSLAKGSYFINKYEQQMTKLLEENNNLKISFAESNFLDRALLKIKELNFQKATSVKYLQILDDAAKVAQDNKNI